MQPIAWSTDLASIVLGNSLAQWLYAMLTALFALLLLSSTRAALSTRLAKQTATSGRRVLLAALVQRTKWLFIVAVAVYVGSRHLTLGSRVQRSIELAVLLSVWFQVGLWISALVVHVIRAALVRRGAQHLANAGGFIVIAFIAQAVVWLVALALALANAGVNVVALIAGLGTGGAAIALATRGMLTNLFARASISLDNLFVIGDNLITGDLQGKVESISNRTTQVRSVNGELILIANADLLKSRLRNFGRIEERREVLTLRLQRSTSVATIREALDVIVHTIRNEPMARFERCHFAGVTEDALQLEAVYHVRTGTPAALAEVRDSIDAQLHDAFVTRRIPTAYPVHRLHLAFG